MSFVNSEVQLPLANWFKLLVGRRVYDKENVEDAAKLTNKAITVIEAHLRSNTDFLGQGLTLADIFAASSLSRGFQYVFDKEWQEITPHVTRWFANVVN
jgi:elongation factor 1-gamma